jgi:uncharacterized LabA/DUF88 family protein
MRMLRSGGGKQTSILIDGANLHATCAALGFTVDYKKLIESFDGTIWKNYYFTALPSGDEFSSLRPMLDYIEFNGFTVIQKPSKEFTNTTRFVCQKCAASNAVHQTKTKGNMDIEIAVIAKEIAPYVDNIILFSGDGDFKFLVEGLQRAHGTYITVVSTIKTNPKMCADDLRRQADEFVDLSDIRQHVERTDERTVRRPFTSGS